MTLPAHTPSAFAKWSDHWRPVEERLWRRVVKTDGCWLWTGTRLKGYGTFTHRGHAQRAHRFSWELHNGPIPRGKIVCHHCDNPTCVNPGHLYVGTHADNSADKVARRRVAGERNPRAKLTQADVSQIRRRHSRGERTAAMAREYGVSKSAMHDVVHGRHWMA